MFLETSQNLPKNTCARVSILVKMQASIKIETLAQVFSCEFWKFSKNNFFTKDVWATGSEKCLLSSGATSSISHLHAARKCCSFSAANFICGPMHIEFFTSRWLVFQDKHESRISNLYSAIFFLFDTFCALLESQLLMHEKLFQDLDWKFPFKLLH